MLLKDTDLTFLALNESWLNYSISDCELEIPNYQLFRYDRDLGSGKRGGGGLISYAHRKYHFEEVSNWNLCCPDLEWQWLCLKLPKTRKTYICNIYRPPDGNVDTAIELIDSKVNDYFKMWLNEKHGDYGEVKAVRGLIHEFLGMTFDFYQ